MWKPVIERVCVCAHGSYIDSICFGGRLGKQGRLRFVSCTGGCQGHYYCCAGCVVVESTRVSVELRSRASRLSFAGEGGGEKRCFQRELNFCRVLLLVWKDAMVSSRQGLSSFLRERGGKPGALY